MALARIYLLAYNGVSFVLWAALLGYTLGGGPGTTTTTTVAGRVAAPPPPLLTATQTLALVEIAHAAGGLVRAAPAATALQVGGKNLVVWTVMVPFWDQLVFPAAAAVGGPAAAAAAAAAGSAPSAVSRAGLAGFLGCILAWSASEMVRFGYFAVQLARGREPFGWLKWLRYNAFLVLYPIGLLSEALLVYLALTQVTGIGTLYRAYLFLGLLTYLPAGPYLYMHMLAQRRKMLKRPATKAQ